MRLGSAYDLRFPSLRPTMTGWWPQRMRTRACERHRRAARTLRLLSGGWCAQVAIGFEPTKRAVVTFNDKESYMAVQRQGKLHSHDNRRSMRRRQAERRLHTNGTQQWQSIHLGDNVISADQQVRLSMNHDMHAQTRDMLPRFSTASQLHACSLIKCREAHEAGRDVRLGTTELARFANALPSVGRTKGKVRGNG